MAKVCYRTCNPSRNTAPTGVAFLTAAAVVLMTYNSFCIRLYVPVIFSLPGRDLEVHNELRVVVYATRCLYNTITKTVTPILSAPL